MCITIYAICLKLAPKLILLFRFFFRFVLFIVRHRCKNGLSSPVTCAAASDHFLWNLNVVCQQLSSVVFHRQKETAAAEPQWQLRSLNAQRAAERQRDRRISYLKSPDWPSLMVTKHKTEKIKGVCNLQLESLSLTIIIKAAQKDFTCFSNQEAMITVWTFSARSNQ